MSIVVKTRPVGNKLSSIVYADVVEFLGKATVNCAFSHGLVQGDWIYITSNVDAYNGYWQIVSANTTQFTFSVDGRVPEVDYYQGVTIGFQVSVLDHGVNAVHNPIVYELTNNLYPYNSRDEVYYPSVVDSQSNENGYTKLFLSGNILVDNNPDAINELDFVTIGDEGPYQIITKISNSIIVINLAYDGSNMPTGPVVKYYNNYCINIEVYCGFSGDHPWASLKPYELAAILRLKPDTDGAVKFSISEIVRSYITTRNKPDLSTLPNNIDFACQFYINYYESYDDVDSGEIVTYTGDVTTDINEFEGLAINAMMPFKSQDAGSMSEYVAYDVYLAKWLTLQETMTWIVDLFMDLSFINDRYDDIIILINGELSQTLTDVGVGVIRVPLTFDTAGEYCIQAWKPAGGGSPEVVTDVTADVPVVADWYNISRGFTAWTIDAQPDVSLAYTGLGTEQSDYLSFDFDFVPGRTYALTIRFAVAYSGTGHSNPRGYALHVMNTSSVVQFSTSGTYPGTPGSFFTITITFTANSNCKKVGVYFNAGIFTSIGTPVRLFTFDGVPTTDYQLIETTPAVAPSDAAEITEVYCLTVVDECDSTIIPETGDFRLLEDGDFRLLE